MMKFWNAASWSNLSDARDQAQARRNRAASRVVKAMSNRLGDVEGHEGQRHQQHARP